MGALADATGRPAGGSAAATAAPGAACATELTGCAHCGLPVPPALVEAGAERQFCCAGCRTVYAGDPRARPRALLRAPRRVGARPVRPARAAGRSYAAVRRPGVPASATRDPLPGGSDGDRAVPRRASTARPASGSSSACRASCPGWSRSGSTSAARARRVDLGPGARAAVARGRARSTRSATRRTRSAASRRATWPAQAEDRALLLRIGVAGALAGNIMALAFALYGGDPPRDGAGVRSASSAGLSLLLAVPAVLWPGRRLPQGGLGGAAHAHAAHGRADRARPARGASRAARSTRSAAPATSTSTR